MFADFLGCLRVFSNAYQFTHQSRSLWPTVFDGQVS